MILDAETSQRLDELKGFVSRYRREDLSATDFWDGFWALVGDLDARAFSENVEPELRERYTEILAMADDAGFMVPNEFHP